MASQSYVDIGALQLKEGGGGVAQTSYVDIGALQRQEPPPPSIFATLGEFDPELLIKAWY